MEPYSFSSPPVPGAAPAPRIAHKKLVAIALITGAIASLVSAYILWGGRIMNPLPSIGTPDTLLLSPSTLPLFPAALLDARSQQLTPLSVEGQGEAAVVGYAKGEGREIFLLTQEEGITNVFARDPENPTRGLEQLTLSDTLKLGLSHDPASGLVTFASFEDGSATGTVMALWQGTTTEIALAEGRNPVALKGGTHVVYEREGMLYAVELGSRNEFPLLTVPIGGSYAVDGQSLRAVLYDRATRSLQFFSLESRIAASAERSIPSPIAATGVRLAFGDGKLALVVASEEGLFVLQDAKAGTTRLVPNSKQYRDALLSAFER